MNSIDFMLGLLAGLIIAKWLFIIAFILGGRAAKRRIDAYLDNYQREQMDKRGIEHDES